MTCIVYDLPKWKETFKLTGYASQAAAHDVPLKSFRAISRRKFIVLLLKDKHVTKDVNFILNYVTKISRIEFFEIESEVNLILDTGEIITFKISQKVLDILKSL